MSFLRLYLAENTGRCNNLNKGHTEEQKNDGIADGRVFVLLSFNSSDHYFTYPTYVTL